MLLNLLFGLAAAATLAIVAAALFTAHVGRKVRRGFTPDGRFIDTRLGRLHVVDKGSGPTILLIHGLGGQTGNFTYGVLPRLATRFRVIAIDRLGCGHSDALPTGFSGVKRHAAVIAEAMDALGVGRAVIVGHSMGGAVTLALAASVPKRVAALALIAPLTAIQHEAPKPFRMLLIGRPWVRRLISQTFATPLSIMRSATTLNALFGPEPIPKDYGTRGKGFLSLRPQSYVAASTDLFHANDDLPDLISRYGRITAPTSILFGRGDRVLDPALHGESCARLIPNSKLVLMEGGHMLPVTAPDAVAAFIEDVTDWATSNAE